MFWNMLTSMHLHKKKWKNALEVFDDSKASLLWTMLTADKIVVESLRIKSENESGSHENHFQN